jgi:hypothetical protein
LWVPLQRFSLTDISAAADTLSTTAPPTRIGITGGKAKEKPDVSELWPFILVTVIFIVWPFFDRWHARRTWRQAHDDTVAEFRRNGWPLPRKAKEPKP